MNILHFALPLLLGAPTSASQPLRSSRAETEDVLAGISDVAMSVKITSAISNIDNNARIKSAKSGKCKKGIVPKRWKSQEECCPCVAHDNCVAIFGEDGPPIDIKSARCQAGEDCFKTSYEYPESVGCFTELNSPIRQGTLMRVADPNKGVFRLENHWFADMDACRYSDAGVNFEVDEAAGDHDYADACACAFWGNCVQGCGIMPASSRRALNVVDESRPHHRRIVEEENGVSIHVESDHDERLEWLNLHVADMQQRMLTGKAPRAWDPLFKTYFENVGDISLECSTSDKSVRCTSTANGKSQCALDLIQAYTLYHSEIAASIKENGTHEILEAHDVPDSCK